MKKIKPLPDSPLMPVNQKLAENIFRKKPKKQFELLYRERDESVQQNPIESIIFVKSKPCKNASNDKKIKVQEQFKKIMNDLNAHITQHKKNSKSNQKKSTSVTCSQLKTTASTKKCTKQSDFMPRKNKATQREQPKILKTTNKGNQMSNFQKQQNFQACKSPKKVDRNYTSPKSKNMFSPKSQKIQKQNIENRKIFYQKLSKNKSPNPKTKRKTDKIQPQTIQKTKNTLKRNIRTIPLKVQQYILIEDNFQLVEEKKLEKLETKLLSTCRNNYRDFQNKLQMRENYHQEDIDFEKIYDDRFNDNQVNFIERSSCNSEKTQERSDQYLQYIEQRQCNQKQQSQFLAAQQILEQKATIIQRWWRAISKMIKFRQYLQKTEQKRQKNIKLHCESQTDKNFTTPVNLPSAQSICFNQESNRVAEFTQTDEQNDQIKLLKVQQDIIMKKKEMHQKILKKLLNEKKIQKDEFDNKILIAQMQYEHEIKEIFSLYKLLGRNDNDFEKQNTLQQQICENLAKIKIIQGKKDHLRQEYVLEGQQQQNEDEPEMKIYKIGDKITSEMQQFIRNNKQTKPIRIQTSDEQHSQDLITHHYKKKTNELGEQYFEDFQTESSPEPSPHKTLQTQKFEEFEENIQANNHGSFQANTHFISMLEQFKQQEQIKTQLEKRIAIQMGAIKSQNQDSKYIVDTSILGIHQFLLNFFKFYLYYYKDEFLRFINMPYGYQPEKRLKFIQGYEDTSDDLSQDSDGIIYGLQYIISDDVFDEFLDQYYGQLIQTANKEQMQMIECAKIHDRALFQCFNEALNNFRPYNSIGGPPYIWNCSQKTLTFYFIAEENIQQVFEKTQFKVMKWASALLGLIVDGVNTKGKATQNKSQNTNSDCNDLESIMEASQSNWHPVVFENIEERLMKQEKVELTELMTKWNDIEEQKTSVLYQVSSLVLEQIAFEFVQEFLAQKANLNDMFLS